MEKFTVYSIQNSNIYILHLSLRGFVKLEKIQKSEKNSEVDGWEFQAPAQIFFFFFFFFN